MTKTLKVSTKKLLLHFGKAFIFLGGMALAAPAANAQKTTTDAQKAASDKRAQKVAQDNNMPKTLSITEFRKLNATAKASQKMDAQQVPVTSTKKDTPAVAVPAATKADTKNAPKYRSRSATNGAGKPAAKTPPVGGNSTSGSQNPIQ